MCRCSYISIHVTNIKLRTNEIKGKVTCIQTYNTIYIEVPTSKVSV